MADASGAAIRIFVGDVMVKLVAQADEIVESLLDLLQRVLARALDIFIPELDQHLGDTGDGPDSLHGVLIPRRNGEAGHHLSHHPMSLARSADRRGVVMTG